MTLLLDSAKKSTVDVRPTRPRLGPGRAIPYGRVLGPVVVLAAWWGASAGGLFDPRLLPAPDTVLAAALDLIERGTLQDSLLVSLQRAGIGFSIGATVGIVLALLAGLSRSGEAVVDGWMQVQRSVPTLGLIPLMILWLGIGETFKVVIIAIVVAIIIYIQTYAGLTGIDSRYVELAETVDLSRARFIRLVVLPGALPGLFVGLRLAVTGSWLSLVVLEQINATSGIGYLMFQAQNYAQTEVIVVYGLFGFVSDGLLRLVERKVLAWRSTLSG
ncbi:ABC transporter permease [Virgisporangium aliadipatigenens]|uniref:ABC transporter permease n=1 Tax=Virgisporangium aliadipatigenens TaxID=741659 RepID=A0A8J4DP09_9ACTN|nr:ABC transporter permease [Virgisporangium aliadipatigenens]GIJ44396.1 ABC transporter permease [Virgisporangium aliadipatigenens]